MPWTFLNFLDARGQNVIKAWLAELPAKARAKINARLLHLQAEEHWSPPYVKPITGYMDIYEIRVIRQNIQYRPLGFHGPQKGEFTLVIGAIEQGDRIYPPGAFATAVSRSNAVRTGQSQTCEHDF